ncbi:hypothetical protein [Loktanella agnita]|uniref:hypothetical protein n=1 Tax=Loktanella agnita TaxID=287097 RepID=UPI0039875A56
MVTLPFCRNLSQVSMIGARAMRKSFAFVAVVAKLRNDKVIKTLLVEGQKEE